MSTGTRGKHMTITITLLMVMLAVLAPPAQGLAYAQELTSWQAVLPGAQDPSSFQIPPAAEYTNYAFHILGDSGTELAAGYLEVQSPHGDLVCRGPVTNQGILNVNRSCNDLRPGHNNTLIWITDRPGNTLVLSAYNTR